MNRLYLRDVEVEVIRSISPRNLAYSHRWRSHRDLFSASIATGEIHSAEQMRDGVLAAVIPGAFSE